MSKGKAKVDYLGSEGLVGPQSVPSWDFLYAVSTIKNPMYNLGDRVVLPDGREFRYAKSTGSNALYAAHTCQFTYTGYTAWTAFAVGASVGDKEITIPAAAHAALAKDELRGGYVVIFDGASDYYTTVRGIIGNDAAANGALFKIYLDAALTYAITAGTSACETYQNPYAALKSTEDNATAVAGVPAAYVSATAQYFWVQTKGPSWVSPQTSCNGHGGIGLMWRASGGIDGIETALGITTVVDANITQYAGHMLEGSQSGNGPLIMMK
jgi:hypothetical protein